jgi:hypothetical protein
VRVPGLDRPVFGVVLGLVALPMAGGALLAAGATVLGVLAICTGTVIGGPSTVYFRRNRLR